MTEAFAAWAMEHGWQVTLADTSAALPADIMQRYTIPSEWLEFIGRFRQCANASDTAWFLTAEDYYPKDSGFQWNEFERMSLEAAESDPKCAAQWKEQITTYWDRYFPIVMNVEGEYTYFAIDTETGDVVCGWEPEFEECDVVADSFHAFLFKVMEGKFL